MLVTAKQIAQQLNLSEAAVSMALNQKPGVSTKTRKRVLETARSLGYDFSKISQKQVKSGVISLVFYNKHNIFDTPFFTSLIDGVESEFAQSNYRLTMVQIHDLDDILVQLKELLPLGCEGILLLATEMTLNDLQPFNSFPIPVVLLDNCLELPSYNCVMINNTAGAYQATEYLIKKRHQQPGHLRSAFALSNFNDRLEGYSKAIQKNGMSISRSIVHTLSPSMDGAYSDMLAILEQDEPLASCYFADNDSIAIGAIRAFKEKGYRIPEDIAIVGFDNIPFSSYVEPHLTTINVPTFYMGKVAAERILTLTHEKESQPVKIIVNAQLIIRDSVTKRGL